MSQRFLAALLIGTLFILTFALALLFRIPETLPSFLNGKEYLQTLADLIQLGLWIGAAVWFVWRFVMGHDQASPPPSEGSINITNTTMRGRRNKINVRTNNTNVRGVRMIGDDQEINAE